jgi:hypothetical protein
MKATITDLLKYLNIPVSARYCERLIASHPDYPALLSIVDTLNRLGIPNIPARIEKDQLPDLPFPYVLQLGNKHKDIITIRKAGDLTKHKDKLSDWEGIVLHVERVTTIRDAENNKAFKRDRFFSLLSTFGIAGLILPFIWSLFAMASPVTSAIFVTSAGGLVLGYLLIAKDLGIKFDAVESFCTQEDKVNDCDMVLESGGASLFGLIKLSDMTFIYFLCQACFLAALGFLPAWRGSITATLSTLSWIAIPMVIYSVIYQLKLGSWCKLCLIVDTILVIQATLFFAGINGVIDGALQVNTLVAIVTGSVVIGSFYLLFKGQLENVLQLETIASDAARIKNTMEVFDRLVRVEEVEILFNCDTHIRSGSKDAPLKFVMASNLNCRPCSRQHKEIENLVEMYPDHVSFEFRFVKAKDRDEVPNSNQYIIEYWLRNIRGKQNEGELTKQLLLDWYETMDPKIFRRQYPMDDSTPSEECIAIEKEHISWRMRQEILRTPTFFLNGRKMPKGYSPNDLAVMIPSIVAATKNKRLGKPQHLEAK